MFKNQWRIPYNKEKLDWPHDENTRRWLANQPLWHDHDMWIALCFGVFLGFLVGQLV
jgi:hypothetical protein